MKSSHNIFDLANNEKGVYIFKEEKTTNMSPLYPLSPCPHSVGT